MLFSAGRRPLELCRLALARLLDLRSTNLALILQAPLACGYEQAAYVIFDPFLSDHFLHEGPLLGADAAGRLHPRVAWWGMQ